MATHAARRRSTSSRATRSAVDLLDGAGSAEAKFTIPALPAPSGDALLAQLETAMKALTTYQYSEVLNSGSATIRGSYSPGCA